VIQTVQVPLSTVTDLGSVHTHASVTMQFNLVLDKGWLCSANSHLQGDYLETGISSRTNPFIKYVTAFPYCDSYLSNKIDRARFSVPPISPNTSLVISGTGFYGSNDPTNSVKALKGDRS